MYAVEIIPGQRLDVGVREHCRCPLIFPDFRRDIGGETDRDAGMIGLDDRAGAALVVRVGIGMEESDRDRFDAVIRERLRGRRNAGLVQGLQHGSIEPQPLNGFQAAFARRERLRLLDMDVVEFVLPLPPDLDDIPEACGRNQAGPGALAFDKGVGEQRRRMHHPADFASRNGVLGNHLADAVQDGSGRVVMGREEFSGEQPVVRVVIDDDIRERAADVYAQRIACSHCGGSPFANRKAKMLALILRRRKPLDRMRAEVAP